jgi:DHA1 family tetracycline resistance protein-like MFS transporter
MNLDSRRVEITEDALKMRTEETAAKPAGFAGSPLLVIFITVLIDLIGFGVMIPILPFYVEHFGGSSFEIGALTAVYSLMQFIFAPVLGQLSDRYGRRPILFISILGSAISYVILGLANTLIIVFLGRIIAGITGGNISTAQAYIADVTTPENRAKGMGIIGAAFGLGFVIGPAIGGILSRFGQGIPFYFIAALSFFNAGLLYFVLPETLKKDARRKQFRSRVSVLRQSFVNKNLFFVVALYFLVVTAFSMMTTAFVLYTQFKFDYDAVHNGYLFFYIGVLSAVMQGGLVGLLTKKFGEKQLVIYGTLIMGISFVLVPFVAPQTFASLTALLPQGTKILSFSAPANVGGLVALLLGIAAFVIGDSISNPALTSLGSKYSPPEEQGAGLGVLQSGASLARAVGPAVAGVLLYSASAQNKGHVDDFSLFRTFWTAAAIMLGAFLLSLYFARKS